MEAQATLATPSVDSYTNRPSLPPVSRIRRVFVRPPSVVYVPRSRVEWANRLLNIALAAIALAALSPVMLMIALLVRITSPGPALYTQQRIGMNRRRRPTEALYDRRAQDAGGIVFTIYKFRTMRHDAEKHSGAVWATHNDPRVTSIGRFLRLYRLDELPQLFNVILGDMNIVGPRPERPTIFAELRTHIAEYSIRQRTRPGITGLAQVSNAYDATLDDVRTKVRYDLEYLEKQSLAEDLRIMLRTIPVMLFKRGGW